MASLLLRSQFQFHTGSIKRLKKKRRLNARRSFNSILVRLKVTIELPDGGTLLGFNSILVRLKEIEERQMTLWD